MGDPIRIAPSGNFVTGGDAPAILVWDPTNQVWVLEAVPSGGGPPLFAQWYVDPQTTLPSEDADGSIGKPFATLQDAYIAFRDSTLTAITLVVAPGNAGPFFAAEGECIGKTIAIVGPAPANGTADPANLAQMQLQLQAQEDCRVTVANMHIANVLTAGPSLVSVINLVGCYIVDGDFSGWPSLYAQECTWGFATTAQGPGNDMTLLRCDFGAARNFVIGSSVSWTWDDYTERSFFRAGCKVLGPNLLTNVGANSDAFAQGNVSESINATTRRILAANLITTDRTVSLEADELGAKFFLFDLYTQPSFDFTILNGADASTIYTHAAGAAPIRLMFGNITPASPNVTLLWGQLLDGA